MELEIPVFLKDREPVAASESAPTTAPEIVQPTPSTPPQPTVHDLLNLAPQMYAYKRIAGLLGPDKKRITCISISLFTYAKMLKFAHNDPYAVSAACRAAALELEKKEGCTWSQEVRGLALKKLMGSYMPPNTTQHDWVPPKRRRRK